MPTKVMSAAMTRLSDNKKRVFPSRVSRAIATALITSCSVAALCAMPEEMQSAGAFTLARADHAAFEEPANVLDMKQHGRFMFGRQMFRRQWAAVTSLNGDWGLGPTFIADRCSACHINAGRGSTPKSSDEQLLSMLVRISVAGEGEHGGPKPHPNYGDQLQNHSLDGSNVDLAVSGPPVPPEAQIFLDWDERPTTLGDGTAVTLRKPRLRIEKLAFGPLDDQTMRSLRIAQPLPGLGLLDAVADRTILELAQNQRKLGYNGRPNYVWDSINKRRALGRYGWKANQATLKEQIAAAAIGDMGVASPFFPRQNCPPVQTDCGSQLPANDPELAPNEIEAMEFWLRGLAVPARRNMDDPVVQRGANMFDQAKCAVCHVPELRTAESFPPLPQLANQKLRAYTDLLLHDMGEDLADHRPDFEAGGRDWRTPPLWGIGLTATVSGSTALLHDGRARNLLEAILWHGGEAEPSANAFKAMPEADRTALLRFVESI